MTSQKQAVSKLCILSIASIPLVMTLGNSMLIPALPMIEKQLHISSLYSSLLITAYSVSSIILIPIAGFLSDSYGRKKVILPSLILVFVGGLIAAFASWKMENPYSTIMIARIIQGIGAAGAAPIVLPLVGDLYKQDEQASAALGIVETANTFGKVLSPIIGSLLAAIVWYIPFYGISALSLISFLLVVFFVKTPPRKVNKVKIGKFLKNTMQIFKQEGRWLFPLFLVGGFVMFILFALQVYLSNTLESTFHLKGVKKGFILAIPLMVLCISSLVGGKLIKGSKSKMKQVIIFALLLQACSLFLFRGYDSLLLLLVIISMNGLAIGLLLPTLDALITENIERKARGVITAFYSSARFIGVAAGPPATSLLLGDHIGLTSVVAAFFTLYLVFLCFKKLQI
ncbi:MFS transporter [Bacillus testis]|uniref:MFS transporter n=1 Tax=Bacillus testis TaxID=1622072 RepID=UPI00067EC1D4|nr:MFS transporter [Bacillus testis]